MTMKDNLSLAYLKVNEIPIVTSLDTDDYVLVTNGKEIQRILVRDFFSSLSVNVRLLTVADSPYDAQDSDYGINADCSGGDVTVNLPSSPSKGKIYEFEKTNTANNYIINGNGKTIDENAQETLIAKFASMRIIYDGTEWRVTST